MLLVALLPALATARRCLGLTIEGGGARGGYSAAVVKALTDHLPNEDLQYDIITGVSAGALNTGSFATFAKGQETEMAQHTLEIWQSVKGPQDVFEGWPIWPPVDVFFKRPSLFSTQPLRNLLEKYVVGDIKRHVTVGTTNIDKGRFEVIDGSIGRDKFIEAMMCSSAVPVVFPHQSFDPYNTGKNSTYADGCVTDNLDVSTPITWCLDQGYEQNEIFVDILFDSNVAEYEDDIEPQTVPQVFNLVNALKAHYQGYNFASYVMNAFPQVNFRYIIIPRESLSPTFIFTQGAIASLIDAGTKDGQYYAQMGPSKDMADKVKDYSKESQRIVHAD